MMEFDDVDYGDSKLIEVEVWMNEPFGDKFVPEGINVTLKVFRDGEVMLEVPFDPGDEMNQFHTTLHTGALPEPDTYLIQILVTSDYDSTKKVIEGYMKVNETEGDLESGTTTT